MTNKFLKNILILFFIFINSCKNSYLKSKHKSQDSDDDYEDSKKINSLVKSTLEDISDNSINSDVKKKIFCGDNKEDIKEVLETITTKAYDYPEVKYILNQVYNDIDDESIKNQFSDRLVCAGIQKHEQMTDSSQVDYWKTKFQFDRLPWKSDKYYFWIGFYFKNKNCKDGKPRDIFISSITDENNTIKIAASGNLIKCLYGEKHPIIKYTETYYVGFSPKQKFVRSTEILYPRSNTNLFNKGEVTVNGHVVIGNHMEKKVFQGKYMDSVVINGVFRLILQFKDSFSLSSLRCFTMAKLDGEKFENYLDDVNEAVLLGTGYITINGKDITKGMIKNYTFKFSEASIYYRRLDGDNVPAGLYFRITSKLKDEAKKIANDILEAYMPAFKAIIPVFESIDVDRISSEDDIDSDSAIYVTKKYLGIKIIQKNLELGLQCTFKVDKYEGYCALTAKGLKSPIGIYINVFSKEIDNVENDFIVVGRAVLSNKIIQIDEKSSKFLGGFKLGSFSKIFSDLKNALNCEEKKKFGKKHESLLKNIFPEDNFFSSLWDDALCAISSI